MDSFSCQNEEQYNEKARTSTRREREREGTINQFINVSIGKLVTLWMRRREENKSSCPKSGLTLPFLLLFKLALQRTPFFSSTMNIVKRNVIMFPSTQRPLKTRLWSMHSTAESP